MFRSRRAFALSVLVLIGTALAPAQVTFTQNAISSGDTGTNSVVSADFNNDGILDLVSINNSTLSFYKGLGGGSYAAPIRQTIPINSGQVVAADFSRHGTPDLAIAGDQQITILIGNNNGTFNQGTNISINGFVQSITTADFNGDHLPDLAVSICPSGAAPCSSSVYTGQGNGLFTLASTLADGGGPIVSGDFNADGHMDLAVVAGNQVALYLGSGNGLFQTPVLANLNNVASLAVADFYNNRIHTLAALTSTMIGAGTWETELYSLRYSGGSLLVENQQVLQASTGDPYEFIAGGDLNGDFKDDLFITTGAIWGGSSPVPQQTAYLIGNGNGTFQTPVNVPISHQLPVLPFIRDLDGDSRHDVGLAWTDTATTPAVGGVDVFRNTNATTNCSLPPANQLVVHICAPSSGQIVGQTFTFVGSGSALNGIAKRIELWIDGKKAAQNLEDQLKATVTLTRGAHTASFVVVDTYDNHTSGSVSFTAQF